MPKLRNPVRADIFGSYRKFVELEYMTKGQAKRKLRNAGCGPLKCNSTDIWQTGDGRTGYGRAFYTPGRGWTVHLSKK
ncbi:hypothetical protein AHP7_30 [Aeromonas phage AHPMCC7]|uniref:hypothetical protein n=1 Tax=Salmonella enterica TaxID=28901 RepID=UPI003F4BFB19|nr:hypothetical protein AHP7_30 [Aeromonas phage AHPMCC7]